MCFFVAIKHTKNMQKKMSIWKKIGRTSLVVVLTAAILTLVYFILVWTNLWEKLNSVNKLRVFILDLGFWGRIVFVGLQFLQVTIIPLPSTILTIAGAIIYGPLQGGLLSFSGIMLGSLLAFWLGKTFGSKLVSFMVGEETCKKWVKFLSRAKYAFFFMMLLPMFPDDILCLVAGVTDMSWAFFVLTNLITRPVGIFLTSYLGSGEIIPYHGWGLVVWAVIIIAVAILMWLVTKYEENIEKMLLKLTKKSKKD